MNTTKQSNETREDWKEIPSHIAWRLCGDVEKSAPYAGYMTAVKTGLVRCIRDDKGTRFEHKSS